MASKWPRLVFLAKMFGSGNYLHRIDSGVSEADVERFRLSCATEYGVAPIQVEVEQVECHDLDAYRTLQLDIQSNPNSVRPPMSQGMPTLFELACADAESDPLVPDSVRKLVAMLRERRVA